jgi:hypothetical protein
MYWKQREKVYWLAYDDKNRIFFMLQQVLGGKEILSKN